MTIGELSRKSGIAASAIRYYEDAGLLPRSERRSGRRVYDDDALARLEVIQVAKDAGFTLAEVRQLVQTFRGERWKRLAQRKLAELDFAATRLKLMQAMLRRLLDCGCFDLEECGRVLAARRRG